MTDPFDTSALDNIFGAFKRTPAPPRQPRPVEAEAVMRSTVAALRGDLRPERQRLADALTDAALTLQLAKSGERAVDAMVSVTAGRLGYVREHVDELVAELRPALRAHRWELGTVHVTAADPGVARPVAPPKRLEMVEAIAATLYELKAYDLPEYCDRLELPGHPDPDADPQKSKRVYLRARLQPLELSQLIQVARRVLDDFEDPALDELVGRASTGSGAPVKNLVFGSLRKPDLVLLDALSNELGLVNPEDALLYDADIGDEGLSWRRLVQELLPAEYEQDPKAANGRLHARLRRCLGSPPEQYLFAAYRDRYVRLGVDQPALLPQVWLHYDPKSARQRGGEPVMVTQRMDFLLLLAGRRRVVLEVDGAQHYSDGRQASPTRYAALARGDRELRLAGYEVYRFGGAELPNQETADALLHPFFDRLIGS